MSNQTNCICKCCGQATFIMTIDDMLDNANKYIKNIYEVRKVLKYFNIEFKDLNLFQNRARLEILANKEALLSNNYNIVYNGTLPINLYCNEDFTILESIQINVDFFKDVEIMNIFKTNTKTSDLILEEYLKEFLTTIDERFNSILDELTVINGIIKQRLPNKRFKQKYACNFFPDTNNNCIYYSYNRKKNALSNIDSLKIRISEITKIKNTHISLWLSQRIVIMYPDYGEVCFWLPPHGSADGIEYFKNYLDKDSILYKEFFSWIEDFMDCDEDYFNWNEYNKRGKELHAKLQEIVKHEYILVYCKSFEQIVHRQKELGLYDEDYFLD